MICKHNITTTKSTANSAKILIINLEITYLWNSFVTVAKSTLEYQTLKIHLHLHCTPASVMGKTAFQMREIMNVVTKLINFIPVP